MIIRDKWQRWKSGTQNERMDVCGVVAIRLWWKIVGWFYGMLLLEMFKTSCQMGKSLYERRFGESFKGPGHSVWRNGLISSYFCEGPVKAPIIWQEKLHLAYSSDMHCSRGEYGKEIFWLQTSRSWGISTSEINALRLNAKRNLHAEKMVQSQMELWEIRRSLNQQTKPKMMQKLAMIFFWSIEDDFFLVITSNLQFQLYVPKEENIPNTTEIYWCGEGPHTFGRVCGKAVLMISGMSMWIAVCQKVWTGGQKAAQKKKKGKASMGYRETKARQCSKIESDLFSIRMMKISRTPLKTHGKRWWYQLRRLCLLSWGRRNVPNKLRENENETQGSNKIP